jgi:hypothetical protein
LDIVDIRSVGGSVYLSNFATDLTREIGVESCRLEAGRGGDDGCSNLCPGAATIGRTPKLPGGILVVAIAGVLDADPACTRGAIERHAQLATVTNPDRSGTIFAICGISAN